MSLASRTAYLASLLSKLNSKTSPLIEEFNKIEGVISDIDSELLNQLNYIDRKISKASVSGNNKLARNLQSKRVKLINQISVIKEKVTSSMNKSVEDSINSAVKNIDGVSGQASINNNTLTFSPDADLSNPITDFVKNTLMSPETVVPISTQVTGITSDGKSVTGVGVQPAKIITT